MLSAWPADSSPDPLGCLAPKGPDNLGPELFETLPGEKLPPGRKGSVAMQDDGAVHPALDDREDESFQLSRMESVQDE
jgi:hypothetical protein